MTNCRFEEARAGYISKAKLMSLIETYRQWGDEQILWDLEELPEEDVSPVKRGKWVDVYNGYAYGVPAENFRSCSVCGFKEWEKLALNYCPRCGAKMEVAP